MRGTITLTGRAPQWLLPAALAAAIAEAVLAIFDSGQFWLSTVSFPAALYLLILPVALIDFVLAVVCLAIGGVVHRIVGGLALLVLAIEVGLIVWFLVAISQADFTL